MGSDQEIVLSDDDIDYYLGHLDTTLNSKYHRDISVYDIIVSMSNKKDSMEKSETHTSEIKMKPVSNKQPEKPIQIKSIDKQAKKDDENIKFIFDIYVKRNQSLQEGKDSLSR